tara:strand:- start:233 stop:820 length:588 start_codon:yes stop_codon:yes gene_type:complete
MRVLSVVIVVIVLGCANVNSQKSDCDNFIFSQLSSVEKKEVLNRITLSDELIHYDVKRNYSEQECLDFISSLQFNSRENAVYSYFILSQIIENSDGIVIERGQSLLLDLFEKDSKSFFFFLIRSDDTRSHLFIEQLCDLLSSMEVHDNYDVNELIEKASKEVVGECISESELEEIINKIVLLKNEYVLLENGMVE